MAKKKLSDYTKIEKDKEDNSHIDNIGESKEEKPSDDTPFLPSIFEQFDSENVETKPVISESPEEQILLEPEDIEVLIELPFDAAAQITKWPGWQLSTKETKALTRLWIRPFKEWLKDVDNMPLYLAAITSITIIGEKYIGYKIEQQSRARASITNNSTGNEGIRKD